MIVVLCEYLHEVISVLEETAPEGHQDTMFEKEKKKGAKRNLIGEKRRHGACASEIAGMHRLIGQSAS